MLNTIRNNVFAKILFSAFVVMFVWWIFINVRGLQNTNENYLYGLFLGLLPIVTSILCFHNSLEWGGFRSSVGKSLMFLSIGIGTWGLGTVIFSYYNLFLRIDVPYPSIADVAYIVSWPLWLMGIISLSKAVGARSRVRTLAGKILLILIPLSAFILSYFLLFIVAKGGVFEIQGDAYWELFFDFAYPFGDVIILTSALLVYGLSFNVLGGYFKLPVTLILSGFVINYIADVIFTYKTTVGTFFVAGNVDLLYTIAFFLLSMGVVALTPRATSTDV